MRALGWVVMVTCAVGCGRFLRSPDETDAQRARRLLAEVTPLRAKAIAPDATLDEALAFGANEDRLETVVEANLAPISWFNDAIFAIIRTSKDKELDDETRKNVAIQLGDLVAKAPYVRPGSWDRPDGVRPSEEYYYECIELDPLSQLVDDDHCWRSLDEPRNKLKACGLIRPKLELLELDDFRKRFLELMEKCIEPARRVIKAYPITGDDLGWTNADRDLQMWSDYHEALQRGANAQVSRPPRDDDDDDRKPGVPKGKKEGVSCYETKECRPGLVCRIKSRTGKDRGTCEGSALE